MTRRIFGSSLSALVSVAELSLTENVTWVQNSKFVGGHFSGLTLGTLRLDMGMVAQEPYSGLTSVDVFTDLPPVRQAGLPFVGIANQWLSQRGEEFVELPVLVSRYGTLMADYLVADNLEVLQKLDEPLKRKIADEILALKKFNTNLIISHPRDKGVSEDYLSHSFEVVSGQLFGRTFHEELIAPWLDRLNPNLAGHLPARDHRTAWVPLYYPETILEVVSNKISPSKLRRPFMVPKDSSIAMVVARLIASIDISRVGIVLDEEGLISPSIGDILLTSTPETFALLKKHISPKNEEKFIAPIVIALFQYDARVADEQVLNLIEREKGPYRICIRNIKAQEVSTNVSIEFGSAFEGATDAEILCMARSTLEQINVSTNFARYIIKRLSIKVPYGESRRAIENDVKLANVAIRERSLHGYPIDFGSSTLNDQILLGLWSANAARNQMSKIISSDHS